MLYYVRRGARAERTFRVNPARVYEIYKKLRALNHAYSGLKEWYQWDPARADEVFGAGGVVTTSEEGTESWEWKGETPDVILNRPIMQDDHEEPADDTGPAAQQYPEPSTESETISGVINAAPSPDHQASIDKALYHASASGAAAEDAAAAANGKPPRRGRKAAPVFRLSSQEGAIDEFSPYFFSKAFPELMLDGKADWNGPTRKVAVTLAEYLEHMMWHGDQRCARHRVFCFVAFSMLQRHRAMSQGGYFVSARMKHSKDGDGETLTRQDLAERVLAGDDSLSRAVFFWAESIRGSDAYMAKMKREIDAITAVKLQGDPPKLPSLLMSASCAEYYWTEMLQYLTEYITVVEEHACEDLTTASVGVVEKKLQEYGHVVTTYFEHRANTWIKEVLVPAFGIDTFYAVFEFAKGRGQIHYHLLAWLKDGEPHATMHKAAPAGVYGNSTDAVDAWEREPLLRDKPVPDEYRDATPPERVTLWREEVWCVVREGTIAELQACWAHERVERNVLHERQALPASIERPAGVDASDTQALGDARVRQWKAFLIEGWMRKQNFHASFPGVAFDDVDQWPAPEGTAPKPTPGDAAIKSVMRIQVMDDLPIASVGAGASTDPSRPSWWTRRPGLCDGDKVYEHMVKTMAYCKLHRCTGPYCLRKVKHKAEWYHECSKAGCGPEAPFVNHEISGFMRPENPTDADAHVRMVRSKDGNVARAIAFDPLTKCYRVQLAPGDAVFEGSDARLYICKADDAQFPYTADMLTKLQKGEMEQCSDRSCVLAKAPPGGRHKRELPPLCGKVPPMGKPYRKEPAIVDNAESGIPSIELPRSHPRFVQGCIVLTEWWQANDDHRVILCRAAPEECTAEDLSNVARYVPGYMCKGTDGSSEYAAVFRRLLETTDEDVSVKTLVKQLMIRIVGKDFPRQQVLYMLAGETSCAGGSGKNSAHGELRSYNVTFNRASLKDIRSLDLSKEKGGVSSNGVDKYEKWQATNWQEPVAGVQDTNLSLYQYLQLPTKGKGPVREQIPLVSGGQMWYHDPPSAEYCENMLKLHRPWRVRTDLPVKEAAVDAFKAWHPKPRYVEVEIAKSRAGPAKSAYENGGADGFDYEERPPDWLDMLGDAAFVESTDFVADDFTTTHPEYDHSKAYHSALAAQIQARCQPGCVTAFWEKSVREETAKCGDNAPLVLSNNDPRRANKQQKRAIALLLHALHCDIEDFSLVPGVEHRERRLLLLGRPGAGKSFVLKVMTTLTRLVTNEQEAAKVGAPTGCAAFVGGGQTWHSMLGIYPRTLHRKDFDKGGVKTVQNKLGRLKALLGDEVSLTGRTLLGWIAHRVQTNLAYGAASDGDITGGSLLPFWLMAGDFYQLPPTADTILYNTDSKTVPANNGAAAFARFNDVVELETVVRQDDTQTELRALLESMRLGSDALAYDMTFVEKLNMTNMPEAQQALYKLPGNGSIWAFPHWELAWKRNYDVLQMLNDGYVSAVNERVDAVPVYKIYAENTGSCAKKASSDPFSQLPASCYTARGLLMRITSNLFGEVGQSWGLVNGKMGTVLDVIFAPSGPSPDGETPPLGMPAVIVLHVPDYVGPVWIEGHPKVVPIIPVSKEGDCECKCSRRMCPLQVAEGTSIHSLQGTTIGRGCDETDEDGVALCVNCVDESHRGRCTIKRLACDLGEPKLEGSPSFRNAALVAVSRCRTKDDIAFASAVTLERLSACGRGKAAGKLTAAMERFRAIAASNESEMAALEDNFDLLLNWAVGKARARGMTTMPWEMADVRAQGSHEGGGASGALGGAATSRDVPSHSANGVPVRADRVASTYFPPRNEGDADAALRCSECEVEEEPSPSPTIARMGAQAEFEARAAARRQGKRPMPY